MKSSLRSAGRLNRQPRGAARRAVVARVAGDHAVVVVVVDVLEARAAVSCPALRERLLDLAVERRDLALHFVVVVLARGANRVRGGRAVGRRPGLRLLQEAVGELEIDAGQQLRVVERDDVCSAVSTPSESWPFSSSGLPIRKCCRKSMREWRTYGRIVSCASPSGRVVVAGQAHGVGVAIRFGIRVGLRDVLVAIRVEALDEPRGLLVRDSSPRTARRACRRPGGATVQDSASARRGRRCRASRRHASRSRRRRRRSLRRVCASASLPR